MAWKDLFPTPGFHFQMPLLEFCFETPERNLKMKWLLSIGNPFVFLWAPAPDLDWFYHRVCINVTLGVPLTII